MAEVKICDVKGCGRIIEDEPVYSHTINTDDGSITIKIDEAIDRCQKCAKKAFNRLASTAWNELKSKRKRKPKE